MIDLEYLRSWTGRESTETDIAAKAPLDGLAALLDHDLPPWRTGEVPPLGHWLYFLPHSRQSRIGADGHPQRGGVMPPVPLPRRMWAAGAVTFHAPIGIGDKMTRRSVVSDVSAKKGASGDLVFVTVLHDIRDSAGALCIEERQDIVYRGESAPAPPPPPREPPAPPVVTRLVQPDPVLLFRFSALTFNSHRIHYDRDYARDVEGYPGLIVHGPLSATLLVDHFLRGTPQADVAAFSFRAIRPLFDTEPVSLHVDPETDSLWSAGPDHHPAMMATLKVR